MKQLLNCVATCFAVGAAFAGTLPSAWSNWRYYRPIVVSSTGQSPFVSLEISNDLYSNARPDLADLRVVDDQGRETPYVLRSAPSQALPQPRPAGTMERSVSPGQYSQIVLDLGESQLSHNQATITIPLDNFFDWVEVAVSDDAHDWRVLKDRAPIFRFRAEDREGTQTVNYPDSVARYLRLRILDPKNDLRSAGVSVSEAQAAEARHVSSGLALEPELVEQQTAWRATLPAAGIPITQVRFATSQPEFDRTVTVETSEDGVEWFPVGRGTIYRFQRDAHSAENLEIDVDRIEGSRQWRVRIINGSNAPLDGIRAELMTTPRALLFRGDSARSYTLLYGQSEAKEPQYDLARTLDAKQLAIAPNATLGGLETNATYTDPRPWTEQHPFLLWASLVLAAAALGIVALRALRSSSQPQN
ncbi:MAG TPA: DUF3999 family protein [Candidatus Acidoferrales bacterium]|nr:DUF3999 family protein [Candidatus Acidoferrales bacterium]